MYKIMSNRCIYPGIHYEALEPTILVEENVIWENRENINTEEQDTVNYTATTDNAMTETGNESYVTADGDNTTQYFSVLDSSNQTILNDISDVTINNSIMHEADIEDLHEENNGIDVNNGQVVLFKVDGSDDLYGFQLSHDQQGNLQKYQFKVRQNVEGNLEAIPETIQILPVDNFPNEETLAEATEGANIETFQSTDDFEEIRKEHSVFVKEEEQSMLSEEHTSPEFDEEEIFEEQLDTKEGILEVSNTTTTQKQEIMEEINEDVEEQEYASNVTSMTDDNEPEEDVFYTHEDTITEENFAYSDDVEEDPMDEDEPPTLTEHYEELFVKESHLMDDANGLEEENGVEETETLNESDNGDYDTVEGIHITGDTDENVYENATDIRKSPSYASAIASRKKIIKNVIRKVRIQKNDGKTDLYYLVKNTEKENLGQIPCNSITIRPNPRSILKCSVAATEPQRLEEEEEKYDKRFAKSKEAQQARQFHNFIAQTKIIHAPVRQGRLPRKQQIKPMKRIDEEIVVQEVVVSSNGYIETSEEGVLKERVPLKPTEYIQLTDSDEDFDPKAPHKRKRKSKKRKPMVEITISDSDEELSDQSVKDSDEATSSEPVVITPLKRPRGRPPKHHEKEEEKEVTKRPRGRPPKHQKPSIDLPEEEIIVIKIDNKCPKCPKSFPSEGSLRSHMQYHNFSQSNDAKYICEKCGDTFKNSFLLNRHMNTHKTSNITCTICRKVFNNQAQLEIHKKIHIKQQMFRRTTLLTDSPKIIKPVPRNKCEDCGKVFSNLLLLNVHRKQHKRFFCQSCRIYFVSNFTLGNHLRLHCVKRRSRSPKKQPFLNAVKRSIPMQSEIFQQSKKEVTISKPVATSTVVVTNIKCDSCSMTFATYTSLFKHKVHKHGLELSDKSIVRESGRKSTLRQRIGHSGVRPSTGLKNAMVGLQSKLEAFVNSQKKT